jgi:hypothetical protein
VLRLVTGRLADRTGRHWALTIAGYALIIACVPLLALSPGLIGAGLLYNGERFGKAVRAHRHERTPSRTPTDPSHKLRRPTTITLGPGRLKYAVQPLKWEGQRQGVASLEDSNGCQ